MLHTKGMAHVCAAVDALKAAGEAGLFWTDLLHAAGLTASDQRAGFLVHELRHLGYLVQIEAQVCYILPEAPIRAGSWVRHREHGVVKVTYAREGFPVVKIAKLGDVGCDFRVAREELCGT